MNKKNKKNTYHIIIFFIALFLIVESISLYSRYTVKKQVKDISYNQFIVMLNKNDVKEAEINLDSPTFVFKDKNDNIYVTENPKTKEFKETLLKKDVKVYENINNESASNVVVNLIMTTIYVIVMIWFFKKMMPGSKDPGFVQSTSKITFNDVAGEEELKQELLPLIDYLKNPAKYIKMGARMPKGIVLYGPPGTGKTLTAKAIAGTANVPFFSVSGSDFVELFVGMGAKKVRELFKEAKKVAPCIIFIDEIDAVGGSRGSVNSNSEKDQTINALLNELDGFNGREGIITICATNRLDTLDPALIRPGRFDKQLAVPLPEKKDRISILKIHAQNKKIAKDVNFDTLASMTVGFSGSSLEALLNEAALLAVQKNEKEITMNDIEDAFYKAAMKGSKRINPDKRDNNELKLIACHEAGHAIATKMFTDDSVPKVTIVESTSGAGGATFRTPQKMGLFSKKYMEGLIKVMYAGRASERIFTGSEENVTTGASNDIEQATEIIKQYISVFGMDQSVGLLNLNKLTQIHTDDIVVKEAMKLSNKFYNEAEKALSEYKDAIEALADELIEKESVSEDELDAIITKYNVPRFSK